MRQCAFDPVVIDRFAFITTRDAAAFVMPEMGVDDFGMACHGFGQRIQSDDVFRWHVRAQFFFQFPYKRLQRRFTGLDMAAESRKASGGPSPVRWPLLHQDFIVMRQDDAIGDMTFKGFFIDSRQVYATYEVGIACHLNFKVDNPISARITAMIQNLMTIVGSDHPFFS